MKLPLKFDRNKDLYVTNCNNQSVYCPFDYGGSDLSMKERMEIAEFLCRAANMHDRLVAACEDAYSLLSLDSQALLDLKWKTINNLIFVLSEAKEQTHEPRS